MDDASLRFVQPQVWEVAGLVQAVGDALQSRFGAVAVRGELAGFSRAASGHCYFTLKAPDGTAALRCAMFRRAASLLDFMPADGHAVEVRGRLALYEPRGELQLVVEAMRRAGAGALMEQFLRLKARLAAEGLFDVARKRPLPAYPRRLGVVTSLAAAALRDVATALARRAPHVELIVYPALVQGAEAPAALAAAIATANRRAEVDALIVCRGGGSLEDLWAFNDERVVRAVAGSALPVVCGVGHETDVTLADFAADLRAPTPTAAAELAAPQREGCLAALVHQGDLMRQRSLRRLDREAQRLDHLALRLARPGDALHRQRQRLALLAQRHAQALPAALRAQADALQRLEARLGGASPAQRSAQAQRLALVEARLRSLDPQQVLSRGYAWLSDDSGRALTSVQQVAVGATVQARLRDGRVQARVTDVAPQGDA
jgi:exodeoxyribonuclease VII large subunit